MPKKLSLFRQLIRSTDGVSAVEFGLILPVMAVMLLGGYEYSRVMEVWRKVSITTRALVDLTTQSATIYNSNITPQATAGNDIIAIMNASAQIFAPFNTSPMKIVISELHVNALGIASVVWSVTSSNTTALACGQIITLPVGMAQINSYFIWSQVSYTYTPIFSFVMKSAPSLSDQLLMSPRVSASIPYQNSTC